VHPGIAADPVPPVLSALLVGDSLSVGLEPHLFGWRVYGREGRRADEGLDQLARVRLLSNTIVVELGTNGGLSPAQVQRAHGISNGRTVIWVVPSNYRSAFRVLMDEKQYWPRLKLFRWDVLARENPDMLYKDRIHPTPEGYRWMADKLKGFVW
jgi:lysophospholipase L1-like esterase